MQRPLSEIREYMRDEEKSLHDWYAAYHTLILYPGEPVATWPSAAEIQSLFTEWVKRRREQLFNLICVEWNYPRLRNDKELMDRVNLAASLAELLATSTLNVPSPITTAVLLVRMGLDELCHGMIDDRARAPRSLPH